MSYRRIQDELWRRNRLIGNQKKVLRPMRELGIQAVIRRKRTYRTSQEAAISDGRITENLLK
ncbi:transposase [Paenibacillus sp. FSL M7-0420]|uniref:transposase n=1 Tax=Paenibacillus sp. FSL M7-0420 TaxID=2921609 RepID=UPI004040AE5D